MVGMGEDDEFENRYMPRLETILVEHGVVVEYTRDRAGIDTGLHLYVEEFRPSKDGENRKYFRPTPSRVWFQLKGKHAETLPLEKFQTASSISVQVSVDHLKYWYAAPEPVYLCVYVESADVFLAVDVRDLVEERWGEGFYAAMEAHTSEKISVSVPTSAVLDHGRVEAMLRHRSMRIDGPAFRGRPLGHRLDPLRSILEMPSSEAWSAIVDGLLAAHDFEQASVTRVDDLEIRSGILRQTLLWQSPAFAEFGFADASALREEPQPEQLFGHVRLFVDYAAERDSLSGDELRLVQDTAETAGSSGYRYAVIFRARDLSGTGGLWRSIARETALSRLGPGDWHQLGIEALSYLTLTSTLVYLEAAPHLSWSVANYLA